jgi:hypothetical protein
MILELDTGASRVAKLDLGDPAPDGYFDDGDLVATSGNLYLYVDDVEIGSLFFYQSKNGAITVTLGEFDVDRQDWVDRNPLVIKKAGE